MTHNIRRPLFEGRRTIDAIWFDRALIGEQQARRRVLAHWHAGAALHRVDGGFLLTLAAPRFVDCATLGGLAMCRVGGILASAPLQNDERRQVQPGACWLVRGAQARGFPITPAEQLDPALWIDTSAIALHQPLTPPEPRIVPGAAAPPSDKPLRDILNGVVGEPSAKQRAFLESLKSGNAARPGSARDAAGVIGGAAMAGAGLLGHFMARLLRGGGAGRRAGAAGGGGGKGAPGREPATQTPDSLLTQRLWRMLTGMAELTRMSKLIGWRQAAYLKRMAQMFEDGDIAEALRHAIPLGTDGLGGRPALGALQRRSSLDITGPNAGNTVVAVGNGAEEYLRKTYRTMFERLDRAGRIDEATFVLAELLRAGKEAVDYLERHGRLRQAAELAVTLQLDADIKVRLWILAGDAARAIETARLHGRFEETVRQLEIRQHVAAPVVRMQWAEYLYDKGDLFEAADVLWPLPQYHRLALDWLLEAEQGGRALGARALVRKLLLAPELLADTVPALEELLNDCGGDGPSRREAAARELMILKTQSDATRRFAAALARQVIADREAGLNALDRKALDTLVTLSRNAVLKADLPPFHHEASSNARPLTAQQPPLQLSAGERGTMKIHDARRLPDGHYLLALGEAGVVRVTATGKQVVHFPVPAHHLVLASNGARALALGVRGSGPNMMMRVSRIALDTHRVSDWITQPIHRWASGFDGVLWNVCIENRLVAIDTAKDSMSVAWQVADLPGNIVEFFDNGSTQALLLRTATASYEQWRYVLPDRRLIGRDPLDPLTADVVALVADPYGNQAAGVTLSATRQAVVLKRVGQMELSITLDTGYQFQHAHFLDRWLVITVQNDQNDRRMYVMDPGLRRVVAMISTDPTERPQLSAQSGRILLFDQAGRLLDIDCGTSKVHRLVLH